ncbi:hypothetical protein [Salinibacterium sp.]|uniref:hypothetical protein n=1 Tax=Salinibacterium sp. TaxID=1915057 RepID=UPI00286D26D1|nr:hypothetical protein [Salinibacterium sp.]
MPWFKVDDGFHGHPKVVELSLGAVGLWTLAGSWCAKYLTDGEVTMGAIVRLGGNNDVAAELVAAKLWIVNDDGYTFWDWPDYQPLKIAVEAERAASQARMREVRAKKKGVASADVRANEPRTTSERSEEQAPNDSRSSENVRLTPSLSQSLEKSVQHEAARDDLDAEFDEFWVAYPRKQSKADAAKAYRIARKTTAAKTILDGTRAYALLHAGDDKNFLKLPGGWLRDSRYLDEVIPPSPLKDSAGYDSAEAAEAAQRFATARALSPLVEVARMCERHDGYPRPCAACERQGEIAALLPEGASF